MTQLDLFLDLFLVGVGALAGGWVCRRLDVPEVLGYLGAGVLLGPALHHGAAFVDSDTIRAIGGFSVVFRMFLLGLDFDPRRLRGRWRPALTAGLLEMGLATLAGLALAAILRWPLLEGAVLGAALGTTSTSILARALGDRGMSHREDARAAGAATLAEDLIAMALLAILTIFGTASPTGGTSLLENATWLVVFASLAFTAGAIFVPLGLDRLGRSRSEELLTLGVVGILFAFAALSIGLGAGPAVGAFLAGIAVGAARHAPGLSQRVLPLRDMLVPVSYVGIGLVLQVDSVLEAIPIALALSVVFVLLKATAVTVGLRLGGTPTVTAARAGAILGQAGTMGLVLACSPFLVGPRFPLLVAIAFLAWVLTVALTPLRLRYAPGFAEAVARALGGADRIERREARLPRPVRAGTRAAAYVLLLSLGCSLALSALAALVARADDVAFGGAVRLTASAFVALVAGFAAVPFAIVAGVAGRRLLHAPARDAALAPRALAAREEGKARRAWGHAGAILGLLLAVAAPAAMLYAIAPPDAIVVLGTGFGLGLALSFASSSLVERLAERVEGMVAPRPRPLAGDVRLHDFRGLTPFGWEVEAILVRPGTAGAWRTLRELAIPERTSARVVAVLRPGSHDSAPTEPETMLHPGDEVVLGGAPQAIVRAREYLLRPVDPAPLASPPPAARGGAKPEAGHGTSS